MNPESGIRRPPPHAGLKACRRGLWCKRPEGPSLAKRYGARFFGAGPPPSWDIPLAPPYFLTTMSTLTYRTAGEIAWPALNCHDRGHGGMPHGRPVDYRFSSTPKLRAARAGLTGRGGDAKDPSKNRHSHDPPAAIAEGPSDPPSRSQISCNKSFRGSMKRPAGIARGPGAGGSRPVDSKWLDNGLCREEVIGTARAALRKQGPGRRSRPSQGALARFAPETIPQIERFAYAPGDRPVLAAAVDFSQPLEKRSEAGPGMRVT